MQLHSRAEIARTPVQWTKTCTGTYSSKCALWLAGPGTNASNPIINAVLCHATWSRAWTPWIVTPRLLRRSFIFLKSPGEFKDNCFIGAQCVNLLPLPLCTAGAGKCFQIVSTIALLLFVPAQVFLPGARRQLFVRTRGIEENL